MSPEMVTTITACVVALAGLVVQVKTLVEMLRNTRVTEDNVRQTAINGNRIRALHAKVGITDEQSER